MKSEFARPLQNRVRSSEILIVILFSHKTYRRLVQAMGAMTPEQRCMVPIRYKKLHGKDLLDVMKSECGNKDFGVALQFLAVNPVEAECLIIDKACKGTGTDELLLFTIICGRTNKEMELLKVRREESRFKVFTALVCFTCLSRLLFAWRNIRKITLK
jgi:hypothetical protein